VENDNQERVPALPTPASNVTAESAVGRVEVLIDQLVEAVIALGHGGSPTQPSGPAEIDPPLPRLTVADLELKLASVRQEIETTSTKLRRFLAAVAEDTYVRRLDLSDFWKRYWQAELPRFTGAPRQGLIDDDLAEAARALGHPLQEAARRWAALDNEFARLLCPDGERARTFSEAEARALARLATVALACREGIYLAIAEELERQLLLRRPDGSRDGVGLESSDDAGSENDGARSGTSPFRWVLEHGMVWHVAFGEERDVFKDQTGFQYVARLLRSPSEEVEVRDLEMADGPPDRAVKSVGDVVDAQALGVGGAKSDTTLDREALRRLLEERDRLNDELEEARELGQCDRGAELEQEKEQLLKQLKKDTFLGRSRALGETKDNRASERVRQAIRRVREKVRKTMPLLGLHLGQYLRPCGTRWRYHPPPDDRPRWEVSP
jgi:hypothetical protein